MSRVPNEAGDATTELVSPPLKKPKIDTEAKADAEVKTEIRILLQGEWNDPEFIRQRDLYWEQFEKSEGYDIDWDNLDYNFPAVKFEWASDLSRKRTNQELLDLCIKTAIDEENEEYGTNLELVKYVSANILGVQGFFFCITFWAQDVSSPNPEPKLYQAKVRKFMDDIIVHDFRLRPTQEQWG
ncbi:PREDICTED: uncharacterized protein LOC104718820 [Camelina sativa]|uniref:Uncharacterized protein LOC104718820 n=1 Tax=Camelina sativa TaxID=90675 RepID=A0ABM0U2P0_CAMSA|nr:PREDICTED: uncharacterized protein LOC104718820 [Camelina sativa]